MAGAPAFVIVEIISSVEIDVLSSVRTDTRVVVSVLSLFLVFEVLSDSSEGFAIVLIEIDEE